MNIGIMEHEEVWLAGWVEGKRRFGEHDESDYDLVEDIPIEILLKRSFLESYLDGYEQFFATLHEQVCVRRPDIRNEFMHIGVMKHGFWIRVFGYGVSVTPTKHFKPSFSIRNGYKKTLNIFGLTVQWLKP